MAQLSVTVSIDAPEDCDGADVQNFLNTVAQACVGSQSFNVGCQGLLVGFVGDAPGVAPQRKSVRIR